MKNKSRFIGLVIICVISLSINIIGISSYKNAKDLIIFDIYGNLINISKVLDNLVYTTSNDHLNYVLSSLERECIQLDTSIHRLNTLSIRYPNNRPHYKFEDFNKLMAITADTYDSEEARNEIIQYNEEIQELIRKLSPKGELSYNEYGELSNIPNYSLSIKQINNFINSTFTRDQLRL